MDPSIGLLPHEGLETLPDRELVVVLTMSGRHHDVPSIHDSTKPSLVPSVGSTSLNRQPPTPRDAAANQGLRSTTAPVASGRRSLDSPMFTLSPLRMGIAVGKRRPFSSKEE